MPSFQTTARRHPQLPRIASHAIILPDDYVAEYSLLCYYLNGMAFTTDCQAALRWVLACDDLDRTARACTR